MLSKQAMILLGKSAVDALGNDWIIPDSTKSKDEILLDLCITTRRQLSLADDLAAAVHRIAYLHRCLRDIRALIGDPGDPDDVNNQLGKIYCIADIADIPWGEKDALLGEDR